MAVARKAKPIDAAHRASALAERQRTLLLALAWAVTLVVSELPAIFWRELSGTLPGWVFWARVALLVVLIGAATAWQTLRPLRTYLAAMLAVMLISQGVALVAGTPLWRQWFAPAGVAASWSLAMLGNQLGRLIVSTLVIATLLALGYARRSFFLARGDLAAQGAPIRWLGITRPFSYARFAPLAAMCIAGGTLAFLVLAGRPSAGTAARLLGWLPIVLPLAALNAFSENMTFRAAPLATLQAAVGPRQSLLLCGVFFGIGHFYGVPYGVPGVIMATALGWLLAKTMLETRGLAWPWLIHFCQDVLILSWMAASMVTPGGG